MPKFRDPVHGYVHISDDELKIIDSAAFQRLRNIRQLATTYLVYHGAEHTRFGHSIGVMHLVSRTFDAVTSKNPCLFQSEPRINDALTLWYRQILRLIALTHDVGHPPFSHASEEIFPDKVNHEVYTKKIIYETDIAGFICDVGNKLHSELIRQYELSPDEITTYQIQPITPQLIWMIYGEKPRVYDTSYIWPDFIFLKDFMDGELDCDKMDYLLRDSLFCGVTYGKYDLDRFISTLTVYNNKTKNELLLAISSDGIQAFEEFVLARYFMFIQVYFHKTRRYFDKLLNNAVKEILPNGMFPDAIDKYLLWDDTYVLHEMKKHGGEHSKQYLERRVMTCVYESPAHSSDADINNGELIFEMIKEKYPETYFLFDDVDKKAHKLLPSSHLQDEDSAKKIIVIDKYTYDDKNIMDCSLILRGIIDKIYICRIYAQGNNLKIIKNDIKKRFENLKTRRGRR